LKIASSLIIMALIIAGCFAGFLYYDHYEKELEYRRYQERMAESERRERREQREREEIERKRRIEQERREQAKLERQRLEKKEKEMHEKNVYYFADNYTAKWVVNKAYGGGSNINIEVNDYDFNRYKSEYKIYVYLSWCGRVFKSKCDYAAKGYIRVKVDGNSRSYSWESTWLSSQLREYQSDMKFFTGAVGAMVILGAMRDQ